jgi:hypothetical protein
MLQGSSVVPNARELLFLLEESCCFYCRKVVVSTAGESCCFYCRRVVVSSVGYCRRVVVLLP